MLAKGFRSVVNKLLVQIGAKIGAEPWAIDKLPFTDKPTMLCSYAIYGKNTIGLLGFVSTFNSGFTKYHTTTKASGTGMVDNALTECMTQALTNVKFILTFSLKKVTVISFLNTLSSLKRASVKAKSKELLNQRSSLLKKHSEQWGWLKKTSQSLLIFF
jgi:hypothetical protein